jgi:hypothetical protein
MHLINKLLQKCIHAHIICVVSQLIYPTFLRKVFISGYLPRSHAQVLCLVITKYNASLCAVLEDLYEYGTKPFLTKRLLDSKKHESEAQGQMPGFLAIHTGSRAYIRSVS